MVKDGKDLFRQALNQKTVKMRKSNQPKSSHSLLLRGSLQPERAFPVNPGKHSQLGE